MDKGIREACNTCSIHPNFESTCASRLSTRQRSGGNKKSNQWPHSQPRQQKVNISLHKNFRNWKNSSFPNPSLQRLLQMVTHVDKTKRGFFPSLYSYKWSNNRSSYLLRFLKAGTFCELNFTVLTTPLFVLPHTASVHDIWYRQFFFPFPGHNFDTVTHYCCQIINTGETAPEIKNTVKENLHPSTPHWL